MTKTIASEMTRAKTALGYAALAALCEGVGRWNGVENYASGLQRALP